MEIGLGEPLASSLDKSIHKPIILFSSFTVLPQTQVQFVGEKFFVLELPLANAMLI